MRFLIRASRPFGFILGVLLCCPPLFSQTTTGRILGTVTDQSGASLPGASLTILDVERGTTRALSTDEAGDYLAPDLIPGTYKVRAEAKGFRSVERVNLELEVAKDLRIDFALQPGQVSETIVVNEEIPLLNTTSSTLGGTLSNQQINDLPLNGRNYENLLQLRPGVTRYPGGGFSTTSTNGLRAEDNGYLIDGLFNSEPYSGQGIINGAGIAGDSATILPIDSIQEFNLQENPSAEYGWKPGAVVNVGLKSGTNGLHGTAFIFGRHGAMDARNCLVLITGDCANSIPDTIADVHAAFLAGVIPNDVSPASLKVSGCTFGVSGAVACDGTGFPTNNNPSINIVNGFPNVVNVNNGLGKVDVHVNERSTVSGMYFFGNNSGTVEDFPELQSKWRSHIHTRAQVFGASWVWIPSTRWVNEARFGYNRLYQPTLPGDLGTPASSYGLDTGVAVGALTGGLPRIGFGGYFFPGLGGFKWPKFYGPDTIVQFIDHISYTAGKHALKFGGELLRNGVTGGAFGNARGSINFLDGTFTGPTGVPSSQLEDFFAGWPTLASVLSGDPTRHLHNWAYAGFFQDDWRVSRNLTVNFGLRYEFNSVVKEAHNLLGNFDPNLGLVQVGKQINAPYNPDHKNFAPRFGFAWDVSGKGNTVGRGGGGLGYETINWQSFLAFNNSFGLPSVPTGAIIDAAGDTAGGTITAGNLSPSPTNPWDNGPIFGDLTKTITCDPVNANPCGIMGVDQHLTTPYVWNWTFNVQHAFSPNLSLEVGYVGNHGANLTGIRDINQPPVGSGWPAALVTACATSGYDPNVCAPADEQGPRPFNPKFPFLSNVFQMGNVYKSNYNGLQATLTARNYHGLSMVAGYTFSHALDDVGANWHFGYGVGLPQDSYNLGREYASSDFDVRHRLTLSLTYAIPGRKGWAQTLEGWEINSIVTLQTPQYWGPIDLGSDASGTGPLPVSPPATSPIRWDFFGKPSDFKSGPTPIPFFPGASNSACAAQALVLDAGNSLGPATTSLNLFGCYGKGNSMMIPPPLGQFGNMGRNTFPDSGFRNFDLSLAKNWHFGERYRAQFRAEFFNILNHPNFANPYGGQNGYGQNDPSTGFFGCGCATPDVAAANPVVGSGGSRAVQLGLKLIF